MVGEEVEQRVRVADELGALDRATCAPGELLWRPAGRADDVLVAVLVHGVVDVRADAIARLDGNVHGVVST
jgi:hypothetical protein